MRRRAAAPWRSATLTASHLGHRAVIGAAVAAARRAGLTPAVFTFELAEGNTLKGGRLLSRSEKYRRMAELGAREILAPPFAAFCALTPEDFVEQVLIGCFAAKAVFCGDNFTFGARAAGDVERLRALCAPHGIAVTVVEMAQYGGRTVSSTRIRAALEEGRLDDANAMLGAPYAIDWTVRHGRGIGTSRLGTPTINQNYPAGTLQPCCGVYLTRIRLQGRWWPAATGISRRPTVEAGGARRSAAKPMFRVFPATFTGRTPRSSSTNTSARCASSARCRRWRISSRRPPPKAAPYFRAVQPETADLQPAPDGV